MANTYITSTSRFRPYTFAEMLQPVQIYTEAYDKIENELANLDILSGDVAGKLSNPKDKELADKALSFQTDLNNAMDSFYSNGLNADTRKQLAGLKARYTKELNPINEAYKAYQEDQKQIINLKRLHPELIVEGIGNSVSDYMYGNTPSGLTANIEDIYNKSMKAATGTSSRFSEVVAPTGILGNQYYQFKTQQGISQDMVEQLRSIVDNPTSTESKKYLSTDEGKALYNIISEQRNANNYNSFSKEGRDRIDASILNGIFAGVLYKEEVDRVSNKNWKAPTDTPPNPPNPPKDNISTLNTITLGTKTDEPLVKQVEKDADILSKFVVIDNADGSQSIKTNEIINLENQISDLQAEITSIEDTKLYKGNIPGRQYRRNRTRLLSSLQRQLESATEKTKNLYVELDDKYSYFNFNSLTNVSKGVKYDNARSQEEVFIGDLQYRPEDEKKLDNSVITDLTGLSGGNVGLFNPGENKALSTETANSLLEGAHVIVKSDEGIVLKTTEGVKYIKGIDNVDSFNASYKKTTNFLKDYTKEGLKTTNIIEGSIEDINSLSPNDLVYMVENGIVSVVSNEGGDTFYGMIVKDSSTNNIYKVLLHPSGYKAVSSLDEIINFGGPSIRKYEEMMLNRGLEHYFNINTRKP